MKPGSRPAYLRRRMTAAWFGGQPAFWSSSRPLQAGEDELGGVEEGNDVSAAIVLGAEAELGGVDEDLQVLGDARVVLSYGSGFDFCESGFGLAAFLIFIGAGDFRDVVVVLAEALGGGGLGRVAVADIEEELGVGVGAGDPGAIGSRCGSGRGVGGNLGGGAGEADGDEKGGKAGAHGAPWGCRADLERVRSSGSASCGFGQEAGSSLRSEWKKERQRRSSNHAHVTGAVCCSARNSRQSKWNAGGRVRLAGSAYRRG